VETPKAIGPFEVRREISRGAGGVVYEAFDPAHRILVAVKLYTAAPKDAATAMGRLRRDAQAAGALGHPNIAAVLGVGEHEGQPWVATQLVAGVSLAQLARSRSVWPIERILDVWRQLCEGLAHAHREGVLHLDLKPADLRVSPEGEVKILDFGSWHLKALERQGLGLTDEGLHYRAPEIVAGRRPDRRADVFAVGAIVYELVTRRKAFPGETTTDVLRALSQGEPDLATLPTTAFSPGFERILAQSLAQDPEKRHASFEDVHADLVQLVRDTAPRLRPPSAAPPDVPPEREALLAAVTQARAEDRLEDALEACQKLLDLDPRDELARASLSEVESVLLNREVDELVGMALTYAADGEIELATGIAEKVERLAPWSPRYLQLQVYLDEEAARRAADRLVAAAREHLGQGRREEARAAAEEALGSMPGHGAARRLLLELGVAAPPFPLSEKTEPGTRRPPSATPPRAAAKPATVAASETPAEAPARGSGRAETPAAEEAAPPADARLAEADALSAAALRLFVRSEHDQAREAVEKALALDPANRRARELKKILRVVR
jgi:serine/threonine protein kinase